jgi:hypothetical protein
MIWKFNHLDRSVVGARIAFWREPAARLLKVAGPASDCNPADGRALLVERATANTVADLIKFQDGSLPPARCAQVLLERGGIS